MENELLLFVMGVVCLVCLGLEKRVAWVVHVSGVCLIIMVALLLASVGLIPNNHPLYDLLSGPNIPIAIALMVFALNLDDILTLPKSLLIIYVIGIITSIIGSVTSALIAAPSLGAANAAKLAAQFAASYIGGGENCVAMKKILDIPNELFVAGFAVDNVLTSIWMVATIVFARIAPTEGQTAGKTTGKDAPASDGQVTTLVDVLFSITLALFSVLASRFLSKHVGLMHPLLYITLIAFGLSQNKLVREHLRPSYLLGTLFFAPFFFSIGAISDLRTLADLPIAVAVMPTVVVAIHGLLIYALGWMLKISSYETSLASQSLIGGPATAVALAQVKNWKAGISMGLIIGLVGYATANFFAMGVYHLSLYLIERGSH